MPSRRGLFVFLGEKEEPDCCLRVFFRVLVQNVERVISVNNSVIAGPN
jgi:hypothetical protein